MGNDHEGWFGKDFKAAGGDLCKVIHVRIANSMVQVQTGYVCVNTKELATSHS